MRNGMQLTLKYENGREFYTRQGHSVYLQLETYTRLSNNNTWNQVSKYPLRVTSHRDDQVMYNNGFNTIEYTTLGSSELLALNLARQQQEVTSITALRESQGQHQAMLAQEYERLTRRQESEREQDRRRVEEERNRSRNTWQRVIDFFR